MKYYDYDLMARERLSLQYEAKMDRAVEDFEIFVQNLPEEERGLVLNGEETLLELYAKYGSATSSEVELVRAFIHAYGEARWYTKL